MDTATMVAFMISIISLLFLGVLFLVKAKNTIKNSNDLFTDREKKLNDINNELDEISKQLDSINDAVVKTNEIFTKINES